MPVADIEKANSKALVNASSMLALSSITGAEILGYIWRFRV
jgi:hypothetical protein